ncbi:MAG: beta-ketoacyl-ACP reductase [Bacteroidales bacterium]
MKFALVTGGSRGIGRAVCIRLSQMGYFILVNYKSNDAMARETLMDIKSGGGDAALMPFDVSSPDEVSNALAQWKKDHPGDYIEVLVNNAGIRRDALLVFMKTNEWSGVLETNLDSFFFLTREVLQDMLVNKYGRIINIVSLSGLKGLPGQVNYSAAKAGLIGATKALAQEVGKKKVTVNAVAPGYIRTDMTKELDEKVLKSTIPMNRFGKPEEVAEAVAFFASGGSSYITGEVLSVNGGLYT